MADKPAPKPTPESKPFWDGANSGLEQYASWGNVVLWSLFAGGSLAGFWCFSGAAFKGKAARKVHPRPEAVRKK